MIFLLSFMTFNKKKLIKILPYPLLQPRKSSHNNAKYCAHNPKAACPNTALITKNTPVNDKNTTLTQKTPPMRRFLHSISPLSYFRYACFTQSKVRCKYVDSIQKVFRMKLQTQLFNGTLFNPRNIRTGNFQGVRHFSLRQRDSPF